MKNTFCRALVLVLTVCVALAAFASCASNKPKTAEECAEEYIKAIIAYDLDRVFELTAGIDYDEFVALMSCEFEMWKQYEYSDIEVIENYYKTDDYKKIIKDAGKRLNENAKLLGFADKSAYAFEYETIVGRELFDGLLEYNEVMTEIFEDFSAYSYFDIKLKDITIDPDSVEMVKLFEVSTIDDEFEVAVALVNGDWMVIDYEFELVEDLIEEVIEEITYRPFAELGWD